MSRHLWDSGLYFDSDLLRDGKIDVFAHFQSKGDNSESRETVSSDSLVGFLTIFDSNNIGDLVSA
jgi:hypothetical protein